MGKHLFNYNSTELLCGIDGGGTTTKVVVCNLHGEIVYAFQTGTINHYGAGIGKARETFAAIATNLTEQLGCIPGIIFTGNSALAGLADETMVQYLTKGVFHPAKTIFHSDAYIALLGSTKGKPGAMLVSGTGSMACGIDVNGTYHTAGGWGQVLGDEGSGYHMAVKGMSAALHAYDGLTGPTQLTGRLMQYFKLAAIPDIIDTIYHPPLEKSVIAGFATEVESAAAYGDAIALQILQDEAAWLYKLALAITAKCSTKNLGYCGSVISRNEIVRSHLSVLLQQDSITLHAPLFSPEVGALIGAFREAGVRLTQSVIDHLLTYK